MENKTSTPEYFKNLIVVQNNKLIKENTESFLINDLKILKLLISKVRLKDRMRKKLSNYYEISYGEIKLLNIKQKHMYRDTLNTLKKLSSIFLTFESEKGEQVVGFIENNFLMLKYSKVIRVSFNKTVEQYLLSTNNFTKYLLADIINFNYKHTLKLYEYVKSINIDLVGFDFNKLRQLLELENKYKRNGDFKKVIMNSVKEINEKAKSVSLSVVFQKRTSRDYILLSITRKKTKDVIPVIEEGKVFYDDYRSLINEECCYKDKIYLLREIINRKSENRYEIILESMSDKTTKEFEFESVNSLTDRLKLIFKGLYVIKSLSNVTSILGNSETPLLNAETKDKKIKPKNKNTLADFKKNIISEFTNKYLANNMPGFLEDQKLFLNEAGLIIKEDKTIIDKKKALAVWSYLYTHKKLVGVVQDVQPIKKFMGVTLERKVKNTLFGSVDILKYIVSDIKKEDEDGYRIYLKNESGVVESSKNTLTYRQLKSLMDKKSF